MNIKQLIEQVDQLYTKRGQLLTLWQEIAENFYPERADFTVKRSLGDDFASGLTTSYPVLVRRDLGDQIGSMLRQTGKTWFHMAVSDNERENNDAKRWLEWAEGVQRRAMHDRVTHFTRATKEGDHDYATFGQTCLSVRLNRNRNALLYRCWHLRDIVWMENQDGELCLIGNKWRPCARDLQTMFGDKNHPTLNNVAAKTPFQEIECYHIIIEAERYDDKAMGKPYFSIYYDKTHNHLLEAIPVWNKEYMIPRWQTVSGSQYAYSPATIVGLPDARLIQAMTYTLLEAGEKLVNPPLIATQDVVKSDVSVYAGGLTWVDMDYDERLGDALRPMNIDAKGMPIGIDMQRDARAMLSQAFFLNKLRPFNPGSDPEMTAFQAGQIVQDWVRQAIPLFAPMEDEYNGQLCELTFDLLLRNGAFGPPHSIPPALQGADIQFRFESPLHDAIESMKGQKFLEMKGLIAEAMALDESVAALPDVKVALRDALNGARVPAKWIRNEVTVEQITDAQEAAKESAQVLAAMQTGSEVAANLGKTEKDLAQAGNV